MQFFLATAAVAREAGTGFAAVCERLSQEIPELAGAGAALDPELGRRVRKGWEGASWGAEGLSYAAAGRSYWVSRGAFFQVNRFLVETLVRLVTAGRSGELAWDLYAGVGLFSRPLSETFGRVVAVEGGEAAARDLAIAGKKGGFEAARSGIVEFLRVGVLQRERPELIVLDPPRAGLGVEGCGLISRIGAAEVVYVSCDPTTLARDLLVLVGGGYDVEKLDLVDLFPQTFHMETVVRLRRR
jgi:23S rRNA (uracil1939-C5)-methyltransferase